MENLPKEKPGETFKCVWVQKERNTGNFYLLFACVESTALPRFLFLTAFLLKKEFTELSHFTFHSTFTSHTQKKIALNLEMSSDAMRTGYCKLASLDLLREKKGPFQKNNAF